MRKKLYTKDDTIEDLERTAEILKDAYKNMIIVSQQGKKFIE